MKIIALNKKATYDFSILEKYEAGIVLLGSEVKSIRANRVNLRDSFIKIIKGEAFLFEAHISTLGTTNMHYKPDEKRPRKLLLHKKEIDKLYGKSQVGGFSIVALKLYFNTRNKAKLEIALAKGKNLHDKRESLKEKIQNREIAQSLKEFSRR
ncbi:MULTISPECIES: SsrA-binding protein SmpB [Helicobacter]|uniref:SsrA-binding protein n=1 Tax=Helicobacter ibis TaxID=2962633 RepID=A0ABT4VCZ1_9HELI|nr:MULTISPECIES: SsrA-binding protein SmpB [Helicobacter]MDA3966659.1 SsrA-binding protein SmpB [Helicobacter sp. WB40]MDA3968573.1 SsrA-binding protein SmpB [Helicobacter ibis]